MSSETFNPESPPEFDAELWINTDHPPTLADLKGRVVVVAAFQLDCKGSLSHGIPQARRIAQNFDPRQVMVLGLLTPFGSAKMPSKAKVEAFAAEHGLFFPIAVDKFEAGSGMSRTMEAYELRGTPSVLVFDRQGRVRRHYLGEASDMRLAAEVMAMLVESPVAPRETSIALEQLLHASLVDPDRHHHHDHGDGCGCGHDHGEAHGNEHQHHHGHDHKDDGSCCGGKH
ncbi:MAG: redoxin domain-containing protein [Hyphomicrobiaceae bacterium]|nr:redoxin domain-containing protein [Hyphomicrobiaceae bacterium]